MIYALYKLIFRICFFSQQGDWASKCSFNPGTVYRISSTPSHLGASSICKFFCGTCVRLWKENLKVQCTSPYMHFNLSNNENPSEFYTVNENFTIIISMFCLGVLDTGFYWPELVLPTALEDWFLSLLKYCFCWSKILGSFQKGSILNLLAVN